MANLKEDKLITILDKLGPQGINAFGQWMKFKTHKILLSSALWLTFIVMLFGTIIYIFNVTNNIEETTKLNIERYTTIQEQLYTIKSLKQQLYVCKTNTK